MILKGLFCSSLEKFLPESEAPAGGYCSGSALRGEKYSLQFAFLADNIHACPELAVSMESPLKKHIRIRQVELVPCRFLCNRSDDDMVSVKPGLFPDPLMGIHLDHFRVPKGYWRSLWIDVTIPKNCKPGKYPLTLTLRDVSPKDYKVSEDNTSPIVKKSFTLEVIDAVLPAQRLIHTEWFHADCLMNYYHVSAWSEDHWRIVENFMKSAADHGINMILTPVFTPPLDTAVGGERRTTQLVKIQKKNGKYQFDFSCLERWLMLAKKCGFEYIEISHLFTQWGAAYCPKIVAEVNGSEKKIFGWETRSDSREYVAFLENFLPKLTVLLKKYWKQDKVYFHCSDEPSSTQLETYATAAKLLRKLVPDFHVFDALSDPTFYQNGLVSIPVSSFHSLDSFVEIGAKPLWTYYCCGDQYKVSNRLLCMTSSRNRILGMLLYRYDLDGFLQWGFNFYNTVFSVHPINPWLIQDAEYAWPAGDAFMVYPGDDGCCVDSLKQEVFFQGLQDLRALRLLESKIGREKVTALLDNATLAGHMCMTEYPRGAKTLLKLREKINNMLKKMVVTSKAKS